MGATLGLLSDTEWHIHTNAHNDTQAHKNQREHKDTTNAMTNEGTRS